MILQLDPDAPLAMRLAADAVLVLHITGGTAGIASGAVALIARKGGKAHCIAGDVFVISMMVMGLIGATVAPFLPQHASVVPGLLTFYLVITGWLTMRPRGRWVRAGEILALVFAVAAASLGFVLGAKAAAAPGGLLDNSSPPEYYAFAGLTAVAAALDLRTLAAGGLKGGARLARHLWRMNTALLIGCISLFIGQPQVFPQSLRGSPVMFVPELLVIAVLVYWLAKIWLKRGRPVVAAETRS